MKKVVFGLALTMGTLAFAQQTQPTPQQKAQWDAKKAEMQKHRTEKMQQHFQEMQTELNLSSAQVTQLKNMHERRAAARKEHMEKQRELHLRNKQEAESEMRKILTPQQYTKWEAMKQAKMEQRKKDRMRRMDGKNQFHGPKGGKPAIS